MNQCPVMAGVPGNDVDLNLTLAPPPDPERKVTFQSQPRHSLTHIIFSFLTGGGTLSSLVVQTCSLRPPLLLCLASLRSPPALSLGTTQTTSLHLFLYTVHWSST